MSGFYIIIDERLYKGDISIKNISRKSRFTFFLGKDYYIVVHQNVIILYLHDIIVCSPECYNMLPTWYYCMFTRML